MKIGPQGIALYRGLRLTGILQPCEVMAIGAQSFCADGHDYLLPQLFTAFGVEPPAAASPTERRDNAVPARTIYEALGYKYSCLDAGGRDVALVLDLNQDNLPADHHGRFGFVTNHGATARIFDQYNAFKAIHELAAPGGLMLHALPMLGGGDRDLFSYQPQLFDDLAKSNSYETLGIWVGLDPATPVSIPWHDRFFEGIAVSAIKGAVLFVLYRKMYDAPFNMAFQGHYAGTQADGNATRYGFTIDGRVVSGDRARYFTSVNDPLDNTSAWALVRELAIKRILTNARRGLKGFFGR